MEWALMPVTFQRMQGRMNQARTGFAALATHPLFCY
jgi:hypothetical protein